MSSASDAEKTKYESVWKFSQYRRYSPGLDAVDKFGLIELFREYQVKTILDAGCGSGKFMQRIMEDCGNEFIVHGFDIADNCLDEYFSDITHEVLTNGCLWNAVDFNRAYDAIVCADVLEHIPEEYVSPTLRNLHRCTDKLCYLAIALFQDDFGPMLLNKPLHLTVKDASWWLQQIDLAGFGEAYAKIEKHPFLNRDMWLHVFSLKD